MSHRTRIRRMVLIAAGVAAALPATASAGTIAYDGDTLVVRSGGQDNTLTIAEQGGRVSIGDSSEHYDFPADRCEQYESSDVYPVTCEMPARIRAEAGHGDDAITLFPGLPAELPIHGLGGDGDDELRAIGEPGDVTFDGDAGEDVLYSEEGGDVLNGGAGNDKLTGNAGDDALHGGDGDDLLRADGGADVIDGGPGLDTVDDWGTAFDAPLVEVTLDGQANDGAPGEGDDVRDVENLETYTAGRFVMSDGADRVSNFAAAEAQTTVIEGRGGNDVLTGGRSEHTIDGGAGNDRVEGGWGHDTLTGGPGRDDIFGDSTSGNCGGYGQSCTVPFGNDTIDARDGEVDNVDCGVGEDTAVVDAIDVVAGCERVDAGGGANPVVPGAVDPKTGDDPRSSGPVTPAGARLRLAGRARLRTALRSGLKVRLSGLPAGQVKVTAKHRGKVVARSRAKVATDGTATATLRFTKAAKRALARKKSVPLTIVAGAARTSITIGR
ncbi:MAG TPA: calcium-binding protein [Solirubrobacteraceae bacterium]|jgi:hypothetical protein